MKSIVTGMALSYLSCPSLSHFQDYLAGRREAAPSMVEHPGEVLLGALASPSPEPPSRLGLIHQPGLLDLSDYLNRLSAYGSRVELIADEGRSLLKKIDLAQQLLADDIYDQVGICAVSEAGSAALVLAQENSRHNPDNWIQLTPDLTLIQSRPEYIMLSKSISDLGMDLGPILARLETNRSPDQPLITGTALPLKKIPSDVVEIFQLIQSVAAGLIPGEERTEDTSGKVELLPGAVRPENSRPWFSRNSSRKRTGTLIYKSARTGVAAALTAIQPDEIPDDTPEIRFSTQIDPLLFLISGAGKTELIHKLQELDRSLLNSRGLEQVSTACYQRFQEHPGAYRISLLARDHQELRKEIQFALKGLETAFTQGEPWSSPQGSYFTPDPLGDSGIAFVYPGAFNSYPGMGSELFFSFPRLESSARTMINDMNHSLAVDLIYPISGADRSTAEGSLYQRPDRLIESGISFSVLLTILFDEVFNLRPRIALGYSLGEISMLWANSIWTNGEESSQAWMESRLFKEKLSGRMDVIREYWKGHDLGDDFWGSYILKASSGSVKEACEGEPLVDLAIINTPDETVIVGEKTACQRVITGLACRSLPMPFTAAIHSPAMQATVPDFIELYSNPTDTRPEIDFYTAAHYGLLEIERDHVANSMAEMTTSQLDFPRLIDQVYDHGARIFIEVGPQKTCSRWIERILRDRPHAVIPANKKGQSDLHGILKVISLLVSHGCSLELDPIFTSRESIHKPEPVSRRKTFTTGNELEHSPDSVKTRTLVGDLSRSYLLEMDRMAALAADTHARYLDVEAKLTKNIVRTIALESELRSAQPLDFPPDAIYSREQIEAFTIGDHRECFGDLYTGFGERRIPRLPNGDLLFLDRVFEISEGKDGRPILIGEVTPDPEAWYGKEPGNHLPLVSLLEISLQPCGFLSAARGTIRGREDQDLYFRNLGGEATLISWPADPAGPIESQVELVSTNSLDDVIIQNYAFKLSWGGSPFFSGSSSFGYFPRELLSGQPGLNGSNGKSSWIEGDSSLGSWFSFQPDHKINGKAHLPAITQLWAAKNAGRHSSGFIFADQPLQRQAWFFKNHFFQDPVMPGSLGVETMARSLIAGAPLLSDLPPGLKWRMKAGETLTWKYRGQINPETDSFQVRLHIKDIERSSSKWSLRADGELWRGSTHIYQVDNICLESY